MFTLLCAISIQILKFFCKDRRLLLYMSRTLHLFGTDWCAMMVPIQVIRWYRMQCYGGTDSCATVVPIRRYCQLRSKVGGPKRSSPDCTGWDRLGIAVYSLQLIVYSLRLISWLFADNLQISFDFLGGFEEKA